MILDNASNNNTTIVALGNEFSFKPEERRLCYLGYIIYLIIKKLLFREVVDTIKSINNSNLDYDNNAEDILADPLIY